jgi:glycosyltransferase involved in cell wall biosynthesis
MADPAPLSVAIITLNEERNLGRCLRSVAFAADVVVLDSGSTDRTRELARELGARVIEEPWRGFAAQKNRAATLGRFPWVLSLDADEWLPPGAEREIRAVLDAPGADAYAFDRVSSFSGGFVRRTWGRDRHLRLYRKDRARFEGAHVHESLRLDAGCKTSRVASPLYHLSYRSIADYVDRMNRYTTLAARGLEERGATFSAGRVLFSPAASFAKHYLLKGGWRDGMRGFTVSAGSAFYVLLKYAKLWEATREADPEFRSLVPPTPEDPDPAEPRG